MMDNFFSNADKAENIRDEIARVAEYLWNKGWAERNAGNMSVNITDLVTIDHDRIKNNTLHKLRKSYASLAGQYLMISGTGTRMRDLAHDPSSNVCRIRITDNGHAFQKIEDQYDRPQVLPTSELPAHLAIHNMIIENRRKEKAVLHTHVNELIALTHIPAFTSEKKLNAMLTSMHPETILFLPEGTGLVPFTIPGTEELAAKTIEKLKTHNAVIWEKHGAVAMAGTITEAFDLIDILAKSARIYFTVRMAGHEPDGMKPGELKKIREHYGM